MVLRFNSLKNKILCSWSGGKDSCYALIKAIQLGYEPKVLLNMMNENGEISRSHGLTLAILKQQAIQMKLPLIAIPTTWNDYESNFIDALKNIKEKYNIDCAVFGDIDLQPHRDWEEKVCKEANIKALLPLWKQNRKELILEMFDSNIESMIVSCNTTMGEKYLGKILTKPLVEELEDMGIDACGENGEFHTVVVNCPLFEKEITLPTFELQTINDYCFINWKN